MRARTSRRGFSLVEVLVAVVVLAIGAAGLIQLLAQAQQQHERRRGSEAARRIAENEVQRVRSAGPWSVPTSSTPTRVDAAGRPDPAGGLRVMVRRDLLCDALAERPNDSGAAPPPCPGAFAVVTVRVEHLRGEAWVTRAQRVLHETGNQPASGTWSLAGSP